MIQAEAVTMLSIHWRGTRQLMTFEEAVQLQAALSRAMNTHNSPPAIIIQTVCVHYGLTMNEIMGDRRDQPHAFVRQMCMFMIRDLTTLSLSRIGEIFPKNNGLPRDHGTVLHAYQLVNNRRTTESRVAQDVDELRSKLIKELPQADHKSSWRKDDTRL